MRRYIPGYGIADVAPGDPYWTWRQTAPGACSGVQCLRRAAEAQHFLPVEHIEWGDLLEAMRAPRRIKNGGDFRRAIDVFNDPDPTRIAQLWAGRSSVALTQRAKLVLERTWRYGPEPLRTEALGLLGVGPVCQQQSVGGAA